MREGRNASTQVSVGARRGVYHHDCLRNWNGLFIGCQSRQEHTHTDLRFPVWLTVIIIFFFLTDYPSRKSLAAAH